MYTVVQGRLAVVASSHRRQRKYGAIVSSGVLGKVRPEYSRLLSPLSSRRRQLRYPSPVMILVLVYWTKPSQAALAALSASKSKILGCSFSTVFESLEMVDPAGLPFRHQTTGVRCFAEHPSTRLVVVNVNGR
jgi:hypothetical protein